MRSRFAFKSTDRIAFYAPIALSNDGSVSKWHLVAKVGEWFNQRHGELPITRDDLATMFANFKNGLYPPRPQELPVDYEHLSVKPDRKPGDGVAAGWFGDVDLREAGNELWALINWNDEAVDAIKKKKYKGFSPLFAMNWTAHGKKAIGPTLLGGALTNYQTIPDCVVTLSLDPLMAVQMASAADLSLSDRERRVREAIEARFPPVYRGDGIDWASYVYVVYVFDDRVAFTRNGRTFEIKYVFRDDLAIQFDGDEYEVTIGTTPVALSQGVTHMKVMKVKDAKGNDVDVPVESFASLTLDALSEIPAIADLRKKIPTEGTRVVPASEFDALGATVRTLSSTVEALKSNNDALTKANNDAQARLLDNEIASLTREGRVLPADVEFLKKLANTNRALFDERVTQLRAAAPVIALNQTFGAIGDGTPGGNAVEMFDALVEEQRKKDPKLTYADAIKAAGVSNPDLARARNAMLSPGFINGMQVNAPAAAK